MLKRFLYVAATVFAFCVPVARAELKVDIVEYIEVLINYILLKLIF